MQDAFLTIKEAAQFVGRSDVTIRRLIKKHEKIKTAETDRCITVVKEFGNRFYRIEARFLLKHLNIPNDFREKLLSQLDHTSSQLKSDQGSPIQSPSLNTHTDSTLTSTANHPADQKSDSPTQMNKNVEQVPTQKTSDQSNDQPNEQRTDQSESQMNSHPESNGSVLLKEVVDELRSQLNTKDGQIKEKDKQIATRDKLLEDQNATIQKMLDGIQQGNFLVASAQERIPLPSDNKRETMSSHQEIVETKPESELGEVESKDDDQQSDDSKPKRGLFRRITDKLTSSNP